MWTRYQKTRHGRDQKQAERDNIESSILFIFSTALMVWLGLFGTYITFCHSRVSPKNDACAGFRKTISDGMLPVYILKKFAATPIILTPGY